MPQGLIRHILFDLDGVLVETRRLHFLAFQEALKLAGIDMSLEEHTRVYDGLPTKVKLEKLAQEYQLNQHDMKKIDKFKQELTLRMLQEHIRPWPQQISMLESLTGLGYHMAVCSNSRRESLDLVIDLMGIGKWLSFTLSNDDVHDPKPSPEMYTMAMSRFAITPERCLIIEDSPHGLKAARASGAHVVQVKDSSEVTLELIRQHSP